MKNTQYAVIGLGRFGSSLAKELVALGHEVLGVDKNANVADEMSACLTHTLVADTTDEEALRAIGIRNMDCVVVAIGDDIQASILTSILLKDLGVNRVVVKALSALHGKVLQRIGVDRVIYPERDMGVRVANQLVSPNLLDFIELSDEYAIAEISATGKLARHSLKELDTRAKYGCTIVAINREKETIVAPSAEEVLHEGDVMVIIGTNEQIDRFERSANT
ncbi:TrkA family potassium uptake protein [Cohnella pontilimi]|uniref:TrkA family potassium uptake protein n=1 Tax=Cohnella pontilimi TaxID=2564100 RepID=A0A4U0FB11_9BACL|nr:TrkA family potassium uptake protein [Cohnella pontilimi]TJY41861.1 TrkA family potassium uptake protein [Cohnella pontilimi]